ncbi:MAG: hypothetical protein WC916_01245 [Candidatus Woesearchaeota archaeon]
MNINKIDLLKKGWSADEINHASKIIADAENSKHIGIKYLDKSLFRALLFLLVIINIVTAIFLFPFIFIVKGEFVTILIALIGFIFGVLFTILIADIDRFDHTHHRTFIATFIISGIINLGIIIKVAQAVSIDKNIPAIHSPYILGGAYLVAFLIPYFMYLLLKKNRK